MGNERFDLNNKAAWEKKNIPKLLEELGFIKTPESEEALGDFIDKINIKDAKITKFLQPIAVGYLGQIKPPLPKPRKSSLI